MWVFVILRLTNKFVGEGYVGYNVIDKTVVFEAG